MFENATLSSDCDVSFELERIIKDYTQYNPTVTIVFISIPCNPF